MCQRSTHTSPAQMNTAKTYTGTSMKTDTIFHKGNPNNSSDTREDIDLVDSQDGYRSQDWQSADFMDDHHHDNYHYQETGITENPNFDKYGNIEWSEVEHCDANEIVEPTSIYEKDESFLQDALNWIQREQYMEKAQESEPVVMWDVEQAFPVSEYFLERLKDLEMDWETFQTRLGEELCNLETQQVEEAAIHIHSMYKKTTRGNPLTVYEFIQGLREKSQLWTRSNQPLHPNRQRQHPG